MKGLMESMVWRFGLLDKLIFDAKNLPRGMCHKILLNSTIWDIFTDILHIYLTQSFSYGFHTRCEHYCLYYFDKNTIFDLYLLHLNDSKYMKKCKKKSKKDWVKTSQIEYILFFCLSLLYNTTYF